MKADIEKYSFDLQTKNNILDWLNGQYDDVTKNEIESILINHPKLLVDAFYTHLTFGTGGLRGIMGVGTNRMNRYTVALATQGLIHFLQQQSPNQSLSIFIGYDSRNSSKEFAEMCAKVAAGNNVRAYLSKDLRSTPLVSFGCRYKKCQAAIMITASHNPPEYNGYKVYGSDGAQMVSPNDQKIVEAVIQMKDISQVKCVENRSHPLIEEVGDQLDHAYLQITDHLQHYPDDNHKKGKDLSIIYTSLHGTGINIVPKILNRWGFNSITLIDEQVIPDGKFPTSNPPNPEDPNALKLGTQKMKEVNGDLLIATDPDTDRLGIAVMHQQTIQLLNGNQVACLLLYHVLEALQKQNRLPKNGACIKTIVTTELFAQICDDYQVPCFNVLTGFKYIAELIRCWEHDKYHYSFIFGGEESYGYLYGTHARDKDAVICAALVAEMALQAKVDNKTLVDRLHEIYKKYGVYQEKVISISFPESKEGKDAMIQAIESLQKTPPKSIGGLKVTCLEDYHLSIKTDFIAETNETIHLPKSFVFLFWLEDGSKLVIRPSGTEPKIKIYAGVNKKAQKDIAQTIDECQQKIDRLLSAAKEQLFTH